MTLANLRGDGRDSIALGWHIDSGQVVQLLAWDFNTVNGTPQFTYAGAASTAPGTKSFSLASGDLYGDQHDEIVLGYNGGGVMGVDTYEWRQPSGPNPVLTRIDQWQDGQDDRNNIDHLALAVGDLNKDNKAEVVAVFKDANPFGFQTLYLDADANKHLQRKDWSRHDPTINAPITLSLGDWDNDSLRAFVKGRCAQVLDADVTAANFIPPYWQNIQGSQGNKGGPTTVRRARILLPSPLQMRGRAP